MKPGKKVRKLRNKEVDPVEAFALQLQQQTFVVKGFPLILQLLAFKSIPLLLEKLPKYGDSHTFIKLKGSGVAKLSSLSMNDLIEVENDTKLLVRHVVPIGDVGDVKDGWGEFDDEDRDKNVLYLEGLIRDGVVFDKAMWSGGDATLESLEIDDKDLNGDDEINIEEVGDMSEDDYGSLELCKGKRKRGKDKEKGSKRKQQRMNDYFVHVGKDAADLKEWISGKLDEGQADGLVVDGVVDNVDVEGTDGLEGEGKTNAPIDGWLQGKNGDAMGYGLDDDYPASCGQPVIKSKMVVPCDKREPTASLKSWDDLNFDEVIGGNGEDITMTKLMEKVESGACMMGRGGDVSLWNHIDEGVVLGTGEKSNPSDNVHNVAAIGRFCEGMETTIANQTVHKKVDNEIMENVEGAKGGITEGQETKNGVRCGVVDVDNEIAQEAKEMEALALSVEKTITQAIVDNLGEVCEESDCLESRNEVETLSDSSPVRATGDTPPNKVELALVEVFSQRTRREPSDLLPRVDHVEFSFFETTRIVNDDR
ncbi:hypothetical protein AALP_AA5G139000 [Arabis alpina]|uniref:Uncharacterized protein n=1 Tax=Arabis alpina TaxID=50452 RepID=A0A087GWY8_ARAAL|nr:hypothetical protein AALP_AA5G139000 [Arabis alpina]